MILVDPLREYETKLRCKTWCHMCSDHSEGELHEFARKLGLKQSWFQPRSYAHYDLTPTKRALAVELGAVEVTAKEGLLRNYDFRKQKGLP